jgi:hypothetical protein
MIYVFSYILQSKPEGPWACGQSIVYPELCLSPPPPSLRSGTSACIGIRIRIRCLPIRVRNYREPVQNLIGWITVLAQLLIPDSQTEVI